MKKIAWITDTTATLPKDFIAKHHIHVIPLQLLFGEQSFKEEEELTAQAFYEKMQREKELPKSSQAAIGDFVSLYEQLKEEYDVGIAVHASSALTGTYQASVQAAEMAGFPLFAIDSKIGSYPLGEMVKQGVKWAELGLEAEVITENIREMAEHTALYLMPANLEQLRRSGRLSGSQAILGTLLKMNLIIKFDDGKVVLSEKIRTAKKAKQYLFDLVATHRHEIEELCIIHADDEVTAESWKTELTALHPTLSITTLILCPVAGVHTGYQTMGVSWIKKQAD